MRRDLAAGKCVYIVSEEKRLLQAHVNALVATFHLTEDEWEVITGDTDDDVKHAFSLNPDAFVTDKRILGFTSAARREEEMPRSRNRYFIAAKIRSLAHDVCLPCLLSWQVLAGHSIHKAQFHTGYVLATGSMLSGDQLMQMVHRARTIIENRIVVLCYNSLHTGYTKTGTVAAVKREAVSVGEALTQLQNPDRLTAFANDGAVNGVARATFGRTVRDVRNTYACPDATTPGLNAVLAPAAAGRANLQVDTMETMLQIITFEGSKAEVKRYQDTDRAAEPTLELYSRIKLEKKALRGRLPAAMLAVDCVMPLPGDESAALGQKRKRESLSPEEEATFCKDRLCRQFGMSAAFVGGITEAWIAKYFDKNDRTAAKYALTKRLVREFDGHASPGYDAFVDKTQIDAQFRVLGKEASVKMFFIHQVLRACGFDGATDEKEISKEAWLTEEEERNEKCAALVSAWRSWAGGKDAMVHVVPGKAFRQAMRLLQAFVGFSVVQTNVSSRGERQFDMKINIEDRYRVRRAAAAGGGGLELKAGESDDDELQRVEQELAAWRYKKCRPKRAELNPFRPVV